MRLRGLNRVLSKPAGGIVSVELVAASDFMGAVYTPKGDCFTSVETAVPFAKYVFREDKAFFTEKTTTHGLVNHTITMEFPAGDQTRRAVCKLQEESRGGFVAVVTMGSGERLLAGYSVRFGNRFPLRVDSTDYNPGNTPADFPAETIVLVSEDTERSKPLCG